MAMIADTFVKLFLQKLGDLVQERAMMLIGVKEDLQRLQRRLDNIKLVLADAERKRIRDGAIDAWVKHLKGVLYDADDLIDDCIISNANLMHKEPSSSTSSLRRCISLFSCCSTISVRNRIALKIEEINNSLDEIYKNQSQFNLRNIIQDDYVPVTGKRREDRETDGAKDPNVVGVQIENATNKLVGMMFDKQDQRDCLVFAICGMGGIGKTTLAQCIFSDKRITSKTKVWLCISQVYDNKEILQQLIRGVDGDPGNATGRAELLHILEEAVQGKDIFLVLDDVWPGQKDVWNDLLHKIMQRQQGEGGPSRCRVLLTSRNENVALKMGATHDRIHHVDELSETSGWELLCKLVFANRVVSEIDGRLKDVGLQIVKKCKGLPLAIKVISGVLITKGSDVTKWKNLLSSHVWSMSELPEELKGALYLSYEELPSYLKQCFIYLSLFPEDFIYDKSCIVRMWVAEGFILPQGKLLLEEIAEGYFEELISRNIIQEVNSFKQSKMHDIVRFLGQHLSKDESYFYGGEESQLTASIEFKARRIYLDNMNEIASILQQIPYKESLRTLLCFGRKGFEIDDVLFKFSYLRVLSLAGSGIWSLPESIGDLVHLRFLNLRGTKISVLPNSISRLKILLSLDVSRCKELRALPKEITQPCNLRHLVTEHTKLSHLPKGIGRLKQLNELSEFIIGKRGGNDDEEEGCSLEELRSLSQLRKICVTNLHRAKVTNDCSALLANHSHLTQLELYFSPSIYQSLEVSYLGEEEEKKVLEVLMPPPPSLEVLLIERYYGRSFPDCMMQASSMENHFPNLTSLKLDRCSKVSKLLPLGQLPHLETLYICGAKSVIHISHEFLGVPQTGGGSMVAFPKLKQLTFQDMRNWESWEEFDEQIISTSSSSIAPCLTSLTLFNCKKLRALPNWLSHSNIRHLEISINNNITSISNLPHLERLDLSFCYALTRVEGLESLRTIELSLGLVYAMERLPKWLSGPIKQRDEGSPYHDLLLELKYCYNEVLMKNCCEGGLDWPIIQLFPKVYASSSGFGKKIEFTYTGGPSGYSFTKESF